MTLRTSRSLLTESRVVVLALRQPCLLLDMEIQTLVAVLAVSMQIVELALAHLPQIVLMQIVTLVAFLAKRFEPVLADVVVIAVM